EEIQARRGSTRRRWRSLLLQLGLAESTAHPVGIDEEQQGVGIRRTRVLPDRLIVDPGLEVDGVVIEDPAVGKQCAIVRRAAAPGARLRFAVEPDRRKGAGKGGGRFDQGEYLAVIDHPVAIE